jgi:hypothetical protein
VIITVRSIYSANSYCDNNGEGSICSTNIIVTILTITGRSICSANSYCDNNDNNGEVLCDANSYCDNNGEVYLQCYELL